MGKMMFPLWIAGAVCLFFACANILRYPVPSIILGFGAIVFFVIDAFLKSKNKT